MKPAPFEYVAPDTLEEALDVLARHGDDAKPLAGGQSLIPTMNFRLAQPAVLVDLNRVKELGYIRLEPDGSLSIGAMTRQRQVERDPAVHRFAPLLAEAMPLIAHPQIRNRGTIGGSLVHADPAAELPVVAVATGATFHIRNQSGARRVAADDFFQGLFAVDLASGELLVEVTLPTWPARTGWSFLEVARRHGDYALAGVAAMVTLDEAGVCVGARLVYMSVDERPLVSDRAATLLTGNMLTEASMAAAAELVAMEEVDPPGNVHASPAYQRHLVRVLTVRALREAQQRARS